MIAGGAMLVKYKKAQLARVPLPKKAIISVHVAEAGYGTFHEKKRFLGTVMPKISADIAPRVTGHLVEVRVREGALVKKGDLLALLDDRPERDKVAELRASLAAAKTAFSTQEAIYHRDKRLFSAKAISQEALDQSHATRDNARAQVIALEKALHTARTDLSYTRLYAPFSGVVTGRLADPGDLALPGKAVVSMEEPDKGYYVSARVPQGLFPSLKIGGRAFIQRDNGRKEASLKGAISRIHPAVHEATLATVEIDMKERPFDLPSGAAVDVDLVTRTVKGWQVPARALLENVDATYLFVVRENSTVHVVKVDVLAKGPEEVVVKGTLKKDLMVVVAQESGLLRLHEGQKVRIIPAPGKEIYTKVLQKNRSAVL